MMNGACLVRFSCRMEADVDVDVNVEVLVFFDEVD